MTIECHQQDQARQGVTTQRRRAKRDAGHRHPTHRTEASDALCAHASTFSEKQPAHHPEGAAGAKPCISKPGINGAECRLLPLVSTRPGLGQCDTTDRIPPCRDDQPREVSLRSGDGEYLTTVEAARYLRMSVSRLLHLADLPYVRGRPNIYRRQDLEDWFERNKTGQGPGR